MEAERKEAGITERNRTYSSIILRIFNLLLCLTLFSTWLLSNLYARYTTEVSGEDSARVAKFSITDTSDLQKNYAVTLIPGQTEKMHIQITNNSEVSVRYIFTFSTEGNLPLQLEMKADNQSQNNQSQNNQSQNEQNQNEQNQNNQNQENPNLDQDLANAKQNDPVKNTDSNTWTIERQASVHGTDYYTAELSLDDAGYAYSGGVEMLVLTVRAEQID